MSKNVNFKIKKMKNIFLIVVRGTRYSRVYVPTNSDSTYIALVKFNSFLHSTWDLKGRRKV